MQSGHAICARLSRAAGIRIVFGHTEAGVLSENKIYFARDLEE